MRGALLGAVDDSLRTVIIDHQTAKKALDHLKSRIEREISSSSISLLKAITCLSLKGGDHEMWNKAIDEEMDALLRNETWEIVPRPKDRNISGSRWGFKIKHKANGSIERCKARLAAKEFSRQPDTD